MVLFKLRRLGFEPTWEEAGRRAHRPRQPVPPERRRLDELAGFCHYWRCMPPDVDALTAEEWRR